MRETEETITQKGLEESAAKLFGKNTIVITARGTVGAMCMLPEPMSFNQTCYGLVAKPQVDPEYLYYALKAALTRIMSLTYGTVFETITIKSFDKIEVPLPALTEHRAIAHILGSLDDEIELNETLDAMARAIFKSWFIDFLPVCVRAKADLPAASPAAQAGGRPTGLPDDIAALFPDSFEPACRYGHGAGRDSEMGEIPKGWEVKSLNQIADYLNGLACQKYPPEEGKTSLPVIKIRELRQGITENTDKATSDVPASYIVNDGDVLFSWSGSLLIDIWTQSKCVLNQHLFKVTSESYPKWFYYYWTDRHLTDFQRIAVYKATTMGYIKRHHLADAKCCVADDGVMKIADEEITPLFMLRIQNELEVKKLATLRDTLRSKLISGDLRLPAAAIKDLAAQTGVPDAEKFVEEAGV